LRYSSLTWALGWPASIYCIYIAIGSVLALASFKCHIQFIYGEINWIAFDSLAAYKPLRRQSFMEA